MSEERKIKADEDWKAKVKAEREQLDAQQDQGVPAPDESAKVDQSPEDSNSADWRLPKPEFSTLVGMFTTQAMVAMGMIPGPDDGKAEVHLELARHFIDLLGVVDEKTKGNLQESERRLLEQSLHELRMAFLELSRHA